MQKYDYFDVKLCEGLKVLKFGFDFPILCRELIKDYDGSDLMAYQKQKISKKLRDQLARFFHMVGKRKNPSTLDLGCGCVNGYDERYNGGARKVFEPWFCRALHHLGYPVIGVDVGSLDSERFKHHSGDLLLPDSLDFLASHSFDLVNARALFDSPLLDKLITGSESYMLTAEVERKLRGVLEPQIERVLKPDGFFISTKAIIEQTD